MGWQARLKDKEKFERTCNKCGGTGVKKTYVSMGGQVLKEPIAVSCKCKQPRTPTAERAGLEPVK